MFKDLSLVKSMIHIPTNEWNDQDIEIAIYNALQEINIKESFAYKTVFLKLEEYYTHLPEDVKEIVNVAYISKLNEDCMCDDCLKDLGIDLDRIYTETEDYTAYKPVIQPYLKLPYYLATYTDSNYFKSKENCWQFVKPTKVASSYLCRKCPTLWGDCQLKYTIDHHSRIILHNDTTKDGYICITYLTFAQDEDGEMLILDLPNLHKALASYVMMKYWEVKANMNPDNQTLNMWQTYQKEYQVNRNKAQSTNLLNNLDPDNLKYVNEGNKKNIVSRSTKYISINRFKLP